MKANIESACGFADALEKAVKAINSRKIDLTHRHILFVPDRYTLRAEQLLYGAGGAFDAEVLTFNRLFSKTVRDCENYLPRQSAIILLRKLITDNEEKLKVFSLSAKKTGFAQKMYETITQLQSCRITPEEISAAGSGDKYGDIAFIYSLYLNEVSGKRVDSCGRMDLLIKEIERTPYLENCTVYFCLFDNITKQGEEIMSALCQRAKSAYFYESALLRSFPPVELYRADSKAAELKAAAKRIRDAVYCGMRYRDTAVVCPPDYMYSAKRIFKEYEIPYFIDERTRLSDTLAARALISLRRIFARGHRREDYIALSKNVFSGVEKNDADAFENYCNKFLINYKAFFSPFTLCDDEEDRLTVSREILAAAERVRSSLASFCRTYENIYNAKRTSEFCDCAVKFCKSFDLTECVKIEGVATAIAGVYGDSKFGEQVWESFEDGLISCELATLPENYDCVVIGDAAGFRGARFKKLFVAGFHEGDFPVICADVGIITDSEIKTMDSRAKIEPTVARINERALCESYDLLSSSESLFVSYNGAAEKRVSFLAEELKKEAKSFAESGTAVEREVLRLTRDNERIARHVSCKAGGAQLLLESVSEEGYPFASTLFHALNGKFSALKAMLYPSKNTRLLREADKLFFVKNATAISQIQEYFSCPYKHFLSYGLKLSKRETGELSALDVGNFLHRAVELFVKNGQYDNPFADMQSIVDICAAEDKKYLYEANAALITQLKSEAGMLAETISRQMKAGSFKNLGVEMRFGSDEKSLKSVSYSISGKVVGVKGIIDRVDFFKTWARVIDYKTGRADFDFSDLFYGLKIQLCFYMKIMAENGYRPAGMFYFPAVTSWQDDEYSHVLKGVYCSDEEAYTAMDARLGEPMAESTVIAARTLKADKTGRTKLYKSARALGEKELLDLCEYSAAVMENGIKEILDGCIEKTPAVRSVCACRWCDYKDVCRPEDGMQRLLEPIERGVTGDVD